ncbi:hypothetical protein Taro_041810 [Colocasia esculenta]|uniref:Uncharacterized protein n=1 Tax=Colocasia esculenta TaxID=4460 RepID=A0A843WFB4_COLES|nr:hypothetical protein [Colocasia esculenta]
MGAVAGARLASRACGLRVPLLAASGGGLVAIAVTAFPHDTHASGGFRSVSSRFRSPALGCQSAVAPACVASRPCGVSRVRGGSACGPSTLWRSEVAVLVVRRRSHLVVVSSRQMCRGLLPLRARLRWFLRESWTGNPYWALFARLTPLLPSARGSLSWELSVGRVAEVAVVSCVVSNSESEHYLRIRGWRYDPRDPWRGSERSGRYSGIRARSLLRLVCGFPARFVRVPQVAVVAVPRAWQVWLLDMFMPWRRGWCWTHWQWSSLCGGRFQASPDVVLLVVFGAFESLRHLHVVVVGLMLTGCELWLRCIAWLPYVLNDALVVLVEVLPGLVLPKIALLSLLVEVLPRSALCSFRATVVLPLWFKVCHLVRLRSGEVLLGRLLALLVEVLPKAARCVVRLAVRLAAALVILPCCSFLSLSAALVGLRVPVARMACFVSHALRALPDGGLCTLIVSFVRRSPIGGRHVVLDLCSCFGFRVVVRGVGESGSRGRSLLSVCLVTVRPIGLLILDHMVCRRWEVSYSSLTSDVFRVSIAVCHVVERVLRMRLLSLLDHEEGFAGDRVGCRSVGPNSEVCWWPQPYSFGWRLPLFGPDLASLDTGGIVIPDGEAPLQRSGRGAADGSWQSVGAASWSEEEMAMRREGPHWGSFFVKDPCFWWFPLGVLLVPQSHSWVPVHGGTGVCSFPTLRCVQGPGWFCLWALDPIEGEQEEIEEEIPQFFPSEVASVEVGQGAAISEDVTPGHTKNSLAEDIPIAPAEILAEEASVAVASSEVVAPSHSEDVYVEDAPTQGEPTINAPADKFQEGLVESTSDGANDIDIEPIAGTRDKGKGVSTGVKELAMVKAVLQGMRNELGSMKELVSNLSDLVRVQLSTPAPPAPTPIAPEVPGPRSIRATGAIG